MKESLYCLYNTYTKHMKESLYCLYNTYTKHMKESLYCLYTQNIYIHKTYERVFVLFI